MAQKGWQEISQPLKDRAQASTKALQSLRNELHEVTLMPCLLYKPTVGGEVGVASKP